MAECIACGAPVEAPVYHDAEPFHMTCLPSLWTAPPLGVHKARRLTQRTASVEAGGELHSGGCIPCPAWPEQE